MQPKILASAFDDAGLVEIGGPGGIERDERAIRPVFVLTRRALACFARLGLDFRRKAPGNVELIANGGKAIGEQAIGIGWQLPDEEFPNELFRRCERDRLRMVG